MAKEKERMAKANERMAALCRMEQYAQKTAENWRLRVSDGVTPEEATKKLFWHWAYCVKNRTFQWCPTAADENISRNDMLAMFKKWEHEARRTNG